MRKQSNPPPPDGALRPDPPPAPPKKAKGGLVAELSAIDEFIEAMRSRMHKKAKSGYRGWDATPEAIRYACCKANDYSVDYGHDEIVARMNDAIEAEKYVDVANFAGMLWWRKRVKAMRAQQDFEQSDR